MIFTAEVETMKQKSPVGGQFQGASRRVYKIVAFDSGTLQFQLESESGEKITAVAVTSGPHVDFYVGDGKYNDLCSVDSCYMRPRRQGSVAA